MAGAASGGIPTIGVLPGVTKSGPGLLHGDKISLQSLLQVSRHGLLSRGGKCGTQLACNLPGQISYSARAEETCAVIVAGVYAAIWGEGVKCETEVLACLKPAVASQPGNGLGRAEAD